MPDDGVDDLVGATGISEQFREHRAQRDQNAHTRRSCAESGTERIEYIRKAFPPLRDDADGDSAEDQREERVKFGDRDQHDDERDARQCGDNQLPACCDRFGKLGIGRQDGDCRIHQFSCSVARASVEATYFSTIESML